MESVVWQVGMDATVTKQILQKMQKTFNCPLCLENIVASELLPHNFINLRDVSETNINPTQEFNASIIAAVRYVQRQLKDVSHELNLSVKLIEMLRKKYCLLYGCETHSDSFSALLVKTIVLSTINSFVCKENIKLKDLSKKRGAKRNESEERKLRAKERRHTAMRRRNLNSFYSEIPILNKRTKM